MTARNFGANEIDWDNPSEVDSLPEVTDQMLFPWGHGPAGGD